VALFRMFASAWWMAVGLRWRSPHRPREGRLPWAELLRRVFELDLLRLASCGGRMRIIAFIERAMFPGALGGNARRGGSEANPQLSHVGHSGCWSNGSTATGRYIGRNAIRRGLVETPGAMVVAVGAAKREEVSEREQGEGRLLVVGGRRAERRQPRSDQGW
jgi:hypothetical protein